MDKEHKVKFSLIGLVGSTFKSAVGVAGKSLSDLASKVNQLEATKSRVDRFSALKKEIKSTENKFSSAQKRANELAIEISNTSKPTAKLKKEFEDAKKQSSKLKNSLKSKRETLNQLRSSLKSAGINTRNLGSESKKLARDIDNARKAEEKLQKKMLARKKGKQFRENVRGKAVATGGALVGMAAIGASHSRMATAQGEIASLGIDADGIKKISAEAVKFSETWSGTSAPDFVRASYDIKSGISSLSDLSVAKFTSMAALTGKATKASTGEMTTLFAKGYGVYRQEFEKFGKATIKGWEQLSNEEKDIEFGKSFSVGIASAVQAFRTDGTQMSQAISTLGSAASSAGYSMQEQFAVLGKLQQTFSGSESATKLKAFIKGANKAGKELNLEFTNPDTGKLKSIPEILELIKGKFGDLEADEGDILTKAFGSDEATSLVQSLLNNTKELKTTTESIGKNLAVGLDPVKEMAKKMNDGPGEQWDLAAKSVDNLTASIGKGFSPVSVTLANTIGFVASNLREFIDANPTAATGIIGLGSAVIGGTAALLALGYVLSFSSTVVTGYKAATTGLIIAKTKLSTITSISTVKEWAHAASTKAVAIAQRGLAIGTNIAAGAQWALNAAWAASPIGMIIVGVSALVALGVLLYKKFKPFRDLVDWVWKKIKMVLKYAGKLLGISSKPAPPQVYASEEVKQKNHLNTFERGNSGRRIPKVSERAIRAGASNKIHYNPTVTVNAKDTADPAEIERRTQRALKLSQDEFVKVQSDVVKDQDRVTI